MVWIDIVFLSIIGISALVSLIRGFTREAVSLATWIAAFIISSQFYRELSTLLTSIDDPMIRQAAAIAILFISTLFLGGMINHLIGKLVDSTGLTGTDRVLGLVFGGLRGLLVCCALLFFMDLFTSFPNADWWEQSILIPEFKLIVDWFYKLVGQTSSLIQLDV